MPLSSLLISNDERLAAGEDDEGDRRLFSQNSSSCFSKNSFPFLSTSSRTLAESMSMPWSSRNFLNFALRS